jgi:valyl-tRNA synthetase
MASTQDVRYSEKRVKQGGDLANKLWNASRFVILNVDDVPAEPRPETVEDRWIISRLERATDEITALLESFQFSRAALALYDVLWGEVCDWYIELVKPRLYDKEADRSPLSANLLHVLERVLSLLHPMMPFVTEEIWSFLPGERGLLAASAWPERNPDAIDPEAERVVGDLIEAVTAVRRWRDEVGVAAGTRVRARIAAEGYEQTAAHLAQLARLELLEGDVNGDVETSVAIPGGAVQIFTTEDIDPEEEKRRREAKRQQLLEEIARAEGKLANEQFVNKAPPDVVQAERDKLARFKAELEELGES